MGRPYRETLLNRHNEAHPTLVGAQHAAPLHGDSVSIPRFVPRLVRNPNVEPGRTSVRPYRETVAVRARPYPLFPKV